MMDNARIINVFDVVAYHCRQLQKIIGGIFSLGNLHLIPASIANASQDELTVRRRKCRPCVLNQCTIFVGLKAIKPDLSADLQLRDLATPRARNLKNSDVIRIICLLNSVDVVHIVSPPCFLQAVRFQSMTSGPMQSTNMFSRPCFQPSSVRVTFISPI